MPKFDSFVPVPVLDRSPNFRFQKCQKLMEFHITGLRPVLDRSPNFEKFVPKDGSFVPKCGSFVPKFDFCENNESRPTTSPTLTKKRFESEILTKYQEMFQNGCGLSFLDLSGGQTRSRSTASSTSRHMLLKESSLT